MNNSVLSSIKIQLGIPENHKEFDVQLIKHINSEFLTLYQLGAGPNNGFRIDSEENTWNEFSDNEMLNDAVNEYVYLKVKKVFDPSTSTAVSDAEKDRIKELEFRIMTISSTN